MVALTSLVVGGCTTGPLDATASRSTPAGAEMAGLQASNPPSVAFFKSSIGDEVRFETGSAELSAEARARLSRQAQWLLVNDSFTAVIEGYADSRGAYGSNQPLAARRSLAVQAYLEQNGVPGERIRGAVFGERYPAKRCSTAACLSANRRAVTRLVSDQLL
jgi:peptidoglycan-associated lipoprotein